MMAARQYGNDRQAQRRKIDRSVFAVICFAVALVIALVETEPSQWFELIQSYTRACNELTGAPAQIPDGQMIIHVIDVGQGDSVLVQSGETNILIDAGEANMAHEVTDYLESLGVNELDWVIMTHPHSDHIGGMPAVLEAVEVEHIMVPYIPDSFHPEVLWPDKLTEAMEREDVRPIQAQPGKTYAFGEMTMTVVWPLTSFDGADLNDWSVGLRFSYGDVDYLCCGDMTDSSEDDLINAGFDIRCEIVKSNHHGSTYANGSDFLYAVSPELALISCGEDNDYGHPHDELLARYEYYDIQWVRTDIYGDIRVIIKDGRYTIETQN